MTFKISGSIDERLLESERIGICLAVLEQHYRANRCNNTRTRLIDCVATRLVDPLFRGSPVFACKIGSAVASYRILPSGDLRKTDDAAIIVASALNVSKYDLSADTYPRLAETSCVQECQGHRCTVTVPLCSTPKKTDRRNSKTLNHVRCHNRREHYSRTISRDEPRP